MIETSPKLLSSVSGVGGNDKKATTVVSPTINSTTVPTSTKEKSHVRELKRLFESKRSSISSPLKILPSFKSNKHKDKSNTEELVINDKLLPPIVSSTTSKSPITNNSSTVNLDNIISQADRKYYFYVNEAIRKNQPIVPSLAIRRKSIDLTHSPIKGSLYAQKYQHSYSPSTRTIQVTKTNNNGNNSNGLNNFNKSPISPQTVSIAASPSTSSENLSIDTIENNDTTWIKQKSKANDDYFTDRNVSPSRLPVSRSTFDLKVGKNQSKEEPINIKFNSVLPVTTNTNGSTHGVSSSKPPSSSKTFRFPFSKGKEKSSSFVITPTSQSNDDSNNHDGSISSSSSSGGKLEKESKKDKKKHHHHSQDNESTHHHSDTHHNNEINSKTSSLSLEEDKPSRLFPWVTLRRIKRSNTADISPIKQQQDIKIVKSKIDISHSNQPLLSTVQIVHKAPTPTNSAVPSSTSNIQPPPYNKLTDPIELQKKLNRLSIKQLLEEEKIKQLEESVENGIVSIDDINNNENASKLIEVTEEEIDEQILIQEEMQEEKTSPYSEDTNSSGSSNNSSPTSSSILSGQKQTYVSLSTTILKKDLLNRTSISSPCSPSTSPSQSRLISSLPPKKYVSVAMATKPTDNKSIISLSANNVRTPPNEENEDDKVKSPTIVISSQNQPPIMSAPTSPTLSSSSTLPSGKMGYTHEYLDDGFILDHTATQLSPTSSTKSPLNGKPPANHRLDQLLNSHRGRSASVGSIFEQMTKFVIDDIPPLKVHCSSLEECMETFAKPDPPHGRCFVLDLGNCSLGDEGLTVLSDNFPGRLEIADLSWNDIGSDGMDNFCSMLRREKNYIQSLSLMGNSLNPQMIDLLLESIEIKDPLAIGNGNKQNQPKKGYKGFGLNLKETGIENEGAEYIAMYIGANKYPNIIGLDLTSSSVTDVAMSELSAGLIKTISLTTLILDENYLGDDGALLLADGLKYNKSLTHLQIRNTDIGERGTIEICNACKFNNTITLLDISLNPWQFAGEISLQSLKILKQQLYLKSGSGNNNGVEKILPKIVWKDDGMESNLEVEEILDIVVHFGVDKIVDVLMNGISFSPLIENEKLFEYMTLEAKHINKIFSRIIAPHLDTADHLNSLKLLVALLPIHLRENETFLNSFLDNLGSLFSLLDKSSGSGGKVDFLLLDLLDFFTLVIKSDHRECYEKINQFKLFSKTLQLFFTHHNHNILHQNILGLITETTQSTYLNFYEETTFTNDFFNRLLSFVTDEHSKSPGLRKSNYAHSIEISNLLDSRSNSPFLSTPQWLNFKSTILAKELHLQNNYLCGIVPDRNQKVDQSILSKFEKEFKK